MAELAQDYLLNKKSLESPFPRVETVSDLMYSIQNYYNNTQNLINRTSDEYLTYLDNIASFNLKSMNDLRTIYSLLADLYVLNGRTSKSADIFDLNRKVYENSSSQVSVSGDFIEIKEKNRYTQGILSTNATITKVQIIPKSGDQLNRDIFIGKYGSNKNLDINNIISDQYELSLYSVNKPLVFSLIIDLGDLKPVNNVMFSVDSGSIGNLTIRSLSVSSRNTYKSIPITNSNSDSASANDLVWEEGVSKTILCADFDNQLVRYIKLDLLSTEYQIIDGQRLFSLNLNSLKTGFYIPEEESTVVFGPIQFNDEILKVSIDSVLSDYDIDNPNVIFSIGALPTGPWVSLLNNIEFNPSSGVSNIVNYNTTSIDSVVTDKPVQEVYLRISMTATEKPLASFLDVGGTEVDKYIHRVRAPLLRGLNDIYVSASELDPEYLEVFKERKSYSGYRFTSNIGEVVSLDGVIEHHSNRGVEPVSIGGEVDIMLGRFSSSESFSPEFVSKPEIAYLEITEKTAVSTVFEFDKYRVVLEEYSFPIRQTKSVGSTISGRDFVLNNDPTYIHVLPISQKSGIYKLSLNDGRYIFLDYSSGLSTSSLEFLFKVEDDSVTHYTLSNEVGTILDENVPVSELDGIRYICLFDLMISDIPSAAGLTFNKLYGLKPNSDTEFSISSDGFVFGAPFSGPLTCNRIVKKEIHKTYNGNQLIVSNPKIINYEDHFGESDYKKVYKFDKTRIVKGSLSFDIGNAAINPFITEVDFIDGKQELITQIGHVQQDNLDKNIIELNEDFSGDEFSYITFEGNDDLFSNQVYSKRELIKKGDWCLNFDQDSNRWQIVLPRGIKTSPVFDTKITYNIKGEINNYGLYSVDYPSGVLYTSAPLDSRIVAHYQYSSVFAKYEHLELVEQINYTINGGNVNIQDDKTKSDYLIIYNRLPELTRDQKILISPRVSNLKLNVLTKNEVL